MRQKLSDREILRRALEQYHAREFVDEPAVESARATAGFLWVMVVALLAVCSWQAFEMFTAEQHRDDAAGAAVHAPGAQHADAQAEGEGQDVGHARRVTRDASAEHVREAAR